MLAAAYLHSSGPRIYCVCNQTDYKQVQLGGNQPRNKREDHVAASTGWGVEELGNKIRVFGPFGFT